MKTGFTFDYPAWFIIFCFLLGFIYSFGLYYRERIFKDSGNKIFLSILSVVRFLTVSFIAFLLLSPFFKSRVTRTEKPIIVIARDNSQSVLTTFKKEDSVAYEAKMTELVNALSKDFEVHQYTFGDKPIESGELDYAEKLTDISSLMDELGDVFYNRNLGAIILATDGIYNKGNNPLYSELKTTTPIYTIGLGDTSTQKDIKINKVYYNRIAYLGDKLSIGYDIVAENLQGKSSILNATHIGKGSDGSKLLKTESLSINSNSFRYSSDLIVDSDKPGVQHYRISISKIEGEITTENNVQDIFIEVLDGRQKILLLANAPDPDLSALKMALEKNKNYQVEIEFANQFSKPLGGYNLVILHQLPSATNQVKDVLEKIKQQKLPVWFIAGLQTNVAGLNENQSVITLKKSQAKQNEVVSVAADDFSLFSVDEKTFSLLAKLPPLFSSFGEYMANGNSKVLLYQKIGAVKTQYPLLAFNQDGEARQAVLTAEGIWKWRLYNYQLNQNFEAVDEIISKTIQFLAVKEDKRPFRVMLDKNIFSENEQIIFDAELYDANFELTNEPDVQLTIADEQGKEYNYTFGKTQQAYTLNSGFLPVGTYSYSARVRFNGKDYSAAGEFSVSALNVEALVTQADHNLLNLLSQNTGGKLYYPSNLNLIAGEILGKEEIKPVLYESFKTVSFINLKWIFFILIFLLGVEWFWRKYMGGY